MTAQVVMVLFQCRPRSHLGRRVLVLQPFACFINSKTQILFGVNTKLNQLGQNGEIKVDAL